MLPFHAKTVYLTFSKSHFNHIKVVLKHKIGDFLNDNLKDQPPTYLNRKFFIS